MEIRPYSVWCVDGASVTGILLRGGEETEVTSQRNVAFRVSVN